MWIDAIYENVVIKPLIPLKLKNNATSLQIIIPDERLETEQELDKKTAGKDRSHSRQICTFSPGSHTGRR